MDVCGLRRFVGLVLALVLGQQPVLASVPIDGVFTAAEACPAYVSKNRQTNPGEIRLEPGQAYQVREANRRHGADWYRVLVPGAIPPERWVSKDCGRLDSASAAAGAEPPPARDPCRTPGLADSYVLALSWQPAFCETRPDKPECRIDDPNAYQAGNFTLHGLWPNRAECGIDYGFCGPVRGPEDDFCDYPPIDLEPPVLAELAEVMPSVPARSCLERHEWHKHGTCQTQWSDDDYYAISVDLTRQFNEAGLGRFMAERAGRRIAARDLLTRIEQALGRGARERIQLDCAQGMLVEVRISLPADLAEGESLAELVGRARPMNRAGDCGARFRVDRIGVGR